MARRLQRPARPGHPGHRVDDDAARVDRVPQRPEGEQDGGRVAAGVRDERALDGAELRQTVRPAAELLRAGVREAVPGVVLAGVRQPVRTREIDDDAAGGSVELGRLLVGQADDRHVGLAGERGRVRDQPRHAPAAVPVQARIEGACVLTGQRVGPDRVELELRVMEDAVERLLPGVPGGSDDRDVRHLHSMHENPRYAR